MPSACRLVLDYTDLCTLYSVAADALSSQNTQVCVMTARSSLRATMRERILETTDRLFYHQGIRAVGVDTIAAEIGISKRTLYNHFPSKDELILAYLTRHLIEPRTSEWPLLEQILRYFDRLERWFAADTF